MRLLVVSLALLASDIGAQVAFSGAATVGNEALDRGEYLRALIAFRAAALKSDGTTADEVPLRPRCHSLHVPTN
jgi:hypothetical protein